MSDNKNKALDRRIQAYPRQALYNKVVALSEKQGRSVSSIINDALYDYIDKTQARK